MSHSRVLVITDNLFIYENFKTITAELGMIDFFSYRYSITNSAFKKKFSESTDFKPIDIKKEILDSEEYDLLISAHSKQLFPAELVRKIKCINIHPGLNPNNRGWFPQVFSILNGLPLGATIHEIDELIDHGPIIAQKEVEVYPWDTSLTAYNRVLETEIELLKGNIEKIISGDYKAVPPEREGNLNLKKDFDNLCRLNLDEVGRFEDFLNRLRALTHGEYKNAFFIKGDKKVFVKLDLELKEEKPEEV